MVTGVATLGSSSRSFVNLNIAMLISPSIGGWFLICMLFCIILQINQMLVERLTRRKLLSNFPLLRLGLIQFSINQLKTNFDPCGIMVCSWLSWLVLLIHDIITLSVFNKIACVEKFSFPPTTPFANVHRVWGNYIKKWIIILLCW